MCNWFTAMLRFILYPQAKWSDERERGLDFFIAVPLVFSFCVFLITSLSTTRWRTHGPERGRGWADGRTESWVPKKKVGVEEHQDVEGGIGTRMPKTRGVVAGM